MSNSVMSVNFSDKSSYGWNIVMLVKKKKNRTGEQTSVCGFKKYMASNLWYVKKKEININTKIKISGRLHMFELKILSFLFSEIMTREKYPLMAIYNMSENDLQKWNRDTGFFHKM